MTSLIGYGNYYMQLVGTSAYMHDTIYHSDSNTTATLSIYHNS